MEYFYAVQLRPVYCWCKSEFKAKSKDIQKETNQIPIQSMIGANKLSKELESNMNQITPHTLDL